MQYIDLYRKKPTQARSEWTIEVIFEAAAQILQKQGMDGFNTNAIAKSAGVSIGTLYQYFPNKQAILIAIAKRELNNVTQVIIDNISAKPPTDDTESARAIVQALLKAFGGRQRMRKVLIEALIANGLFDELTNPIEKIVQTILSKQSQLPNDVSEAPTPAPISLYVMTRAIIGTIRAAVMEQSVYLNTECFENELVGLILYFRHSNHHV